MSVPVNFVPSFWWRKGLWIQDYKRNCWVLCEQLFSLGSWEIVSCVFFFVQVHSEPVPWDFYITLQIRKRLDAAFDQSFSENCTCFLYHNGCVTLHKEINCFTLQVSIGTIGSWGGYQEVRKYWPLIPQQSKYEIIGVDRMGMCAKTLEHWYIKDIQKGPRYRLIWYLLIWLANDTEVQLSIPCDQ